MIYSVSCYICNYQGLNITDENNARVLFHFNIGYLLPILLKIRIVETINLNSVLLFPSVVKIA